MKKNIQMLLMAVIALIACSCSEKNSAISQLENFTQELKDNSEEYDTKDWIKAEQKYNEIFDRLDKCKNDLTDEDKEKVAELNAQCAEYYAIGMANLSKKGIEAAGELMKDVGNIVNSAGDMINSAGDMVNDAEEATKKLENLFDE